MDNGNNNGSTGSEETGGMDGENKEDTTTGQNA